MNQDNTELLIQKQKQALGELEKQYGGIKKGKQRRGSYEYKKELQNINELTRQLYQQKQDVLYEGK